MATPQLPTQLDIAKDLTFALYSAANRMIRLHTPLLEPLGLTFPQYLVLVELTAQSPRSVGELGTKLGMEPGTITPLLKRLEASGFVTRTRDRTDERRVLIDLTDSAKSLRRDLWAVSDQIKTACQLNEDQLSELRQTLEALAWPAADAQP